MSKHPAYNIPFTELRSCLEKEAREGHVMKKVSNGLTLFNYLPVCQFDGLWNTYTLVARGIILSEEDIVALPFPKFFNYGEQSLDLPDEIFL